MSIFKIRIRGKAPSIGEEMIKSWNICKFWHPQVDLIELIEYKERIDENGHNFIVEVTFREDLYAGQHRKMEYIWIKNFEETGHWQFKTFL